MAWVVQLRGRLVQHHLVIDGEAIYLIDGGFFGGVSRIKHELASLGKDFSDVQGIILSHGHLDHSLNIARLQNLTDCWIYAPRLDREHIAGRYRYFGWSRVCGLLERIGRLVLRYRAAEVDQWFDDGDDVCGLKVVGLPGHTLGHCGFLLAEEKLLIVNDLFADHFGRVSMPSRVLNVHQGEARRSIQKAAAMDLEGIYLNHGHKKTPRENLLSLINLANDG